MKKLITICSVIVLFGTGYAGADTWTTFKIPGADSGTSAVGISGNYVVGHYTASGVTHGFLYNWATKTSATLDYQGASDTYPRDIDGSEIVGFYGNGGFLYNWGTGSHSDFSIGIQTQIYSISGNNFVGEYNGGNGIGWHGFLDKNGSWTNLSKQGASYIYPYGIDGSNIVGTYADAFNNEGHGFFYDGSNWTIINYPGATGTLPNAISGNNIVGQYIDASGYTHSFLYNISEQSWTTINIPGASSVMIYGIDGSNLVGSYNDGTGVRGLIYTIPEPTTLLLLGLGGMILRKRQ